MDKKLKQIIKMALPSIFVIPLFAAGTALFLDFKSTESDKDTSIISLALVGKNKLVITFSYANLLMYMDGASVPTTAAHKFANMDHTGASGEQQSQNAQQWLQNDYQLTATAENSIDPNFIPAYLDTPANPLSKNSGFLTKMKNANSQGVASFDLFADPIDANNPPPDGEQLASYSLDPSQYFSNPNQRFFQEKGYGMSLPSAGTFNAEKHAALLKSQFRDVTTEVTIAGGNKYSLEFQLNALSSKANDAAVTDKATGWIDQTVGASYFQPYFGDGIWAPDLNTGDVFRYQVYVDPLFEMENAINNTNIVKFDIGANFAISTMSVLNIIWIVGAVVITMSLFSPLIVYAIKKW